MNEAAAEGGEGGSCVLICLEGGVGGAEALFEGGLAGAFIGGEVGGEEEGNHHLCVVIRHTRNFGF